MKIVHKMPNRHPVALNPVFNMPLDAGFMRGNIIQDVSPSQVHDDTSGSPIFTNPGMKFVAASVQQIGSNNIVGLSGTLVSTVSIWVNLDAIGTIEGVFRLNTSDYLQITAGGAIDITGFAGGTAIIYLDGVVATDGVTTIGTNWHHIAITDTVAKDPVSMRYGRTNNAAEYLTGRLGDIRLYAELLTPSQIQSIFDVQRYKYAIST